MSTSPSPRRSAVVFAVALLTVTALVAVSGSAVGQSGVTVELDEVAPEVVQVDEVVTVTYTANGSGITDDDIELVFEHQRGHEVRVDGERGTDITQDVDIEPFELDPGPYDVRVEVAGGPTAEKTEAIEVAPVFDPDNADFGETESSSDSIVATYEAVAGDFLTVDVSLNEIDEAYVIVGGDRASEGKQSAAPLDILHVDGSATFTVNTRLVGTDRPSEEVYIPIDGSVTSYAHSLGPDAEPAGVFEDLHFENEAYDQIADSLTEYRDVANSEVQNRPLQPSQISMVIAGGDSVVVTDDGQPDARFPLDRASIELTQPELDNVTTYRLPTGNADERSFELDPDAIEELEPGDIGGLLDDATESDRLARNDRLLVEIEATGMYGALLDSIAGVERIESDEPALIDPNEFETLIDRPEGIDLELVHRNPGPNTERAAVNLFDSPAHEVSFIVAPAFGENPVETDRFYILVDTREPEPFGTDLAAGNEYEVRMSYTSPEEERYQFREVRRGSLPDPFEPRAVAPDIEVYPYLTPGAPEQRETSTFTVEDRFVEYDQTTNDDSPVVPNTGGAGISGTTNLAPGSDLPVNIVIDVRDDPTKVEIEGVDIGEDGSFAVTTDLSMLDPEEEVTIEFWAYQELLDERPLTVVDEDDVSGSFEVTELDAESVVTFNETFVEMSTVITNTGLLPDTQTVDLIIGDERVANESLDLVAGESRTLNFDDDLPDLEPGEYPLEVWTEDDSEGMILVVDEAEGVFEVSDIDAVPTIEDGEPGLDFETTIHNTGTINETATVELRHDGSQLGERTADLLSGEDVTYSFADELASLGVGNHTLTVVTPDDEATVEVTVEEAQSVLELTDIDVQESIQQNGSIAPEAVVNSTGNVAGSGAVRVEFEGELIDESVVDLQPGESTTVAFDELVVDEEPGTYTLTFETPDDQQTVELVVEEPEDGTEGDTEGSEESSEASSGGGEGGLAGLGIGVGRSAVVGGTALVAGIHVLGYWI